MFEQTFALMAQNATFFYGSIFVFSLIVGSFLNVVIHRLPIMMEKQWECECREHLADELKNPPDPNAPAPAKYNLVVPRSTCPGCDHQITALENIPIISYLLLKGRCSNCKTKISIRYPLVELLTGVLSLMVAIKFGFSLDTAVYLLLTWCLIALSFIDLDKMLLPDEITLPLIWLGLLLSTQGIGLPVDQAIIGGAVGYLSLWSVYYVFKVLTDKEGFGHGDFKLLMVFGVFLGWQDILLIILLSTMVGLMFTLVIVYRAGKSIPVPFGPYIAVAGWIALMWGDHIINYYVNNFLYV